MTGDRTGWTFGVLALVALGCGPTRTDPCVSAPEVVLELPRVPSAFGLDSADRIWLVAPDGVGGRFVGVLDPEGGFLRRIDLPATGGLAAPEGVALAPVGDHAVVLASHRLAPRGSRDAFTCVPDCPDPSYAWDRRSASISADGVVGPWTSLGVSAEHPWATASGLSAGPIALFWAANHEFDCLEPWGSVGVAGDGTPLPAPSGVDCMGTPRIPFSAWSTAAVRPETAGSLGGPVVVSRAVRGPDFVELVVTRLGPNGSPTGAPEVVLNETDPRVLPLVDDERLRVWVRGVRGPEVRTFDAALTEVSMTRLPDELFDPPSGSSTGWLAMTGRNDLLFALTVEDPRLLVFEALSGRLVHVEPSPAAPVGDVRTTPTQADRVELFATRAGAAVVWTEPTDPTADDPTGGLGIPVRLHVVAMSCNAVP